MLHIENIEFSELNIPFKVVFTHASASRTSTQSIWIKVISTDGLIGYGEGCPREYVTGESITSAIRFIENHRKTIKENIHDLDSLKLWVKNNEEIIDNNPAAFCAIELALLDIISQHEQSSVEKILDIPIQRKTFNYTAVLGNSSLPNFQNQYKQYKQMGFNDFKVKLSGKLEDDKGKLDLLFDSDACARIRVDANNLWQEKKDVINYMRLLNVPIMAIEEPLEPARYDDLRDIASGLGVPIILDESFRHRSQFMYIDNNPNFWILNIRVSKMGGLLRTIDIIQKAELNGILIIIGAHVGETSLLTRAGQIAAQVSDYSLLAQEGAFGTHLLRHDVCEEPLMFGRNGQIKFPFQNMTEFGFGLSICDSVVVPA